MKGKNGKKPGKINLGSIKTKISLLLFVSMVLVAAIIIVAISMRTAADIKKTNQNYMLDIGTAYGEALNDKECCI